MTRLAGLAVLVGLIVALAAACGAGGDPTPTVVPGVRTATAEARAATATADAEAALARRPPCMFDLQTQEAAQLVSDVLWQVGSDIGPENATTALRFYEASIAYGLLNECRDIGAVPLAGATPGATPAVVCVPGSGPALVELRNAWAKGMPITLELLMMGVAPEDIELMTALNSVILHRIQELEDACGVRQGRTTSATPVG